MDALPRGKDFAQVTCVEATAAAVLSGQVLKSHTNVIGGLVDGHSFRVVVVEACRPLTRTSDADNITIEAFWQHA